MKSHADKIQKQKNQSTTGTVTQRQSAVESTFQFIDNRPEAVAQRKLQEMIGSSPKVSQLQSLQSMADNSPQAKQQQPVQKKNNAGLPNGLKVGIENLSGVSLDDVKVHCNSDKPAQLQAHAYAQGTDIHLGPGQEKHLPHEAWHVVQQKQGRVKPTMQMKDAININDDDGLEREADVMGEKAAQFSLSSHEGVAQKMEDSGDRQNVLSKGASDASTVQRAPWDNVPAKFRTDNGMDDVPNSEYFVQSTSYKRYAPINEIRAPGQIFHEGPRSFAYIDSGDKGSVAYSESTTALPDESNDQRINLSKGSEVVAAYRVPANGRAVWDGDVNDDGAVTNRHPGHTVMNLGQALPNLDNAGAQKLARYKQGAIREAQVAGLIADDEAMLDKVYNWIDTTYAHIDEADRDNVGMKYLLDHPEVFQEVQDAKDAGQLKFDTEKLKEDVDALVSGVKGATVFPKKSDLNAIEQRAADLGLDMNHPMFSEFVLMRDTFSSYGVM